MLFDKRKYEVEVECENCGEEFELWIPRGIMIKDYLSGGRGRCEHCGCSRLMLKLIKKNDKFQRKEGGLSEELKMLKQEIRSMRKNDL